MSSRSALARDDIATSARPALLRMERITKRFGAAVALNAVDFELRAGEVHALVGENGAGKSTLVKIMTGAYHRDAGDVWLDGAPVDFDTPAEAQATGVYAVHQEIHLLGKRTVAENVFLGREPRRWGFIDWSRMHADATTLFADLGLEIDPRVVLSTLSLARQQMVAIARGVSLGARVLVLDEPTSSLSDRETEILFELIRLLKAQGTAIVYISHRFSELYAVCDRVTVLRDGALVTTCALKGLERLDLVCLMLGKSREALRAGTTGFASVVTPSEARSFSRPEGSEGPAPAEPLLRAESLGRGTYLRDVSFDVRRGEILGLAGLLGSGRTETARAVFGSTPADSGTMRLEGARFSPHSPVDAIRAGVGYLSEDRKADGIIPDLSVRENLTLAALPLLTKYGVVSRRRQMEVVDRFMARLGIKATSAEQRIRDLSGGNQQKVLLARWLCMTPKLLILDEPTRGIDIGAKGEIQHLVQELTASGLGVIMISSEIEELVEGCARVVVLREGRDVAELRGSEISERAIIHAMAESSA
ncbi:MAG: sugar ABC transporter ATP-binding protein [Gemmatimonadota bacterium]